MARQRDDDEGYSEDPPRRRRRDEDEGYSEEPARRPRRDDDEEDDRPRRRRRRDEDDEDDYEARPRRKRRDVARELTGLDATFANTNIVMLVLFACLCGDIALLLGIIGLFACSDEKARTNALIVTCVSAVRVVVVVIAIIMGNLK